MSKSAWFAIVLLLLALPAAAEVKKTTGMRNGKPYLEASDQRDVTATVIAIDRSARVLKLRTESGDTTATVVEHDVKNFDQIQVGDQVKATVKEHILIEVGSGGVMQDSHEISGTSGKPGEKPHGTITEKTRATATITAIDKTTGKVTMKSQDGDEYVVTAQNKENLNKIKVGDMIVFTVTRSVAASVVKATK